MLCPTVVGWCSCSLHTSGLSHRSPVSGKALAEIRQLQYHAQAQLAQSILVGIHEVDEFVSHTVGKVITLQHGGGNLFDAQDLLPLCVHLQIHIVAA